jgi:hypothetical protein
VKFEADAKYLACAKDLTILSMAGRYKQPVQYGKRVRPKTRPRGAPSSLGIYMYAIQHISKEENETISGTREKSAVASAEPKQ